jgi:hypothetical protein
MKEKVKVFAILKAKKPIFEKNIDSIKGKWYPEHMYTYTLRLLELGPPMGIITGVTGPRQEKLYDTKT